MTFLAPLYLYLGGAAALATVAIHLIVRRQPASSPLPTVRFVPDGAISVTTMAPVPEDLIVLAIRALAALLLGTAFARPVLTPEWRPVGRIVLADVSRDLNDIGELRDSVGALLGPGDILVAIDSAPRAMRGNARDAIVRLERSGAAARLSPGLVAALRAASELRESVDSIELVVVSPLRAGAIDNATWSLRALWPGRVRLVRLPGRADSVAPARGTVVSAGREDAVALGARAAGLPMRDTVVRVVRGTATPADSVWAMERGRVLVRWPADSAPPGWIARPRSDTALAVVAGDAALVHPLERRWRPGRGATAGRVVARWVDGEPAATEVSNGGGCIRDVSIQVPGAGDLPLRGAFGQLVRELASPCALAAGGPGVSQSDLERLAGRGPLAPSTAIAPRADATTPLMPWLLATVLVLLVVELLVRRSSARASFATTEEPLRRRGVA